MTLGYYGKEKEEEEEEAAVDTSGTAEEATFSLFLYYSSDGAHNVVWFSYTIYLSLRLPKSRAKISRGIRSYARYNAIMLCGSIQSPNARTMKSLPNVVSCHIVSSSIVISTRAQRAESLS